MSNSPVLPPLPAISLELLEDLSPPAEGFLQYRRRRFRAHYPDGAVSEPFAYDEVDRRAIDAVVIVPHFLVVSGEGQSERFVYLRSAVRPPLVMRDAARSAVVEPENRALWELPAGLVEVDEQSPEGIVRCAQRELLEECGFEVELEALLPLGPSTFPCPGVIAERHYFFHVEVDIGQRREPTLDGSPLEAGGVVTPVALAEALRLCREGGLADAKTELGLRRLAELDA